MTTRFLRDGERVLLEKQGTTTVAVYAYGNALIRRGGEYPLYDGLGSARTVTNANQTVVGTITYEGFGQTVATTGSSSSPYRFAATSGYRAEGDAGLLLLGHLYYDPQVGRFLTRDTYLDEHPYLYCEHDPVNKVDPSGHQGEAVVKFLTGLLPIPGVGKAAGAALVGIGAGILLSKLWDYIRQSRAEDKLIRDALGRVGIKPSDPDYREKRRRLHDRIGEEKIGGGEGRRNPDLTPERIRELAEELFGE